jgi:hypothetical protein
MLKERKKTAGHQSRWGQRQLFEIKVSNDNRWKSNLSVASQRLIFTHG